MLVSIVSGFGNTWFLLHLEIPDADWLSGCVCLDTLHSDCFCCMWYLLSGNAAFSLDFPSHEGGSIFVVPAF